MCLLLLAIRTHPEYKLILAANRDEYYDRPTAAANFWEEAPHLLAGRDLRTRGTWLGITRKGRIAAITDYRDPASVKANTTSRGRLVSDFLLGEESPAEYLDKLAKEQDRYNGFNLIIGEKDRLYWYSNRGDGARKLSPGIYGLSNRLLDTPCQRSLGVKTPWHVSFRSRKSLLLRRCFTCSWIAPLRMMNDFLTPGSESNGSDCSHPSLLRAQLMGPGLPRLYSSTAMIV